MKWYIAKNKPWQDHWWKWRLTSPEFPNSYTFSEAINLLIKRRGKNSDGARCIIIPIILL